MARYRKGVVEKWIKSKLILHAVELKLDTHPLVKQFANIPASGSLTMPKDEKMAETGTTLKAVPVSTIDGSFARYYLKLPSSLFIQHYPKFKT